MIVLCYLFCFLTSFISIAGCPLVSFKQQLANEIASLDQADREVICGTLFHMVNWFREVTVCNMPDVYKNHFICMIKM